MTPAEECRDAVQILRGHELDAEGVATVELLDTAATLLDAAVQAAGNHFPIAENFMPGFADLVASDPIYGPPLALAREINSQYQVMRGGDSR